MAKEKPIIIKNWHKGMAPSAFWGFEEIRGLDITKKLGVVSANNALVKESAAIIDDEIFATATDDNGVMYGISKENTNSVFKRTQAGTWTELSGFGNSGIYGIAFFMGNIILVHSNGSLDASVNDGVDWTNGFATVTNNANSTSPTILAQDGLLYICQGNDVDALGEGSVDFDPTGAVGNNWALSLVVLDLPKQYDIKSVVALGNDLMFGTVNTEDENDATVFPWDRVSPSFDQPIRIKENGVRYLVEVENLLYICAGVKGRWYVSDGTTVKFLAEIPKTMFDLSNINLEMSYNNAVAYNEGLIYFGVSYAVGVGASLKLGVYALNPKTGTITFAHKISTDNIGVSILIRITSITKAIRTISGIAKESIIVCWLDEDAATTYGADAVTNTKYTGDRAFLITAFMPVGTNAVQRTFNRPEIRLSKPLVSGDSLKVYYRTEQNGSWTSLYDEDTVGFQNGIMPAIAAVENIQLKVILNKDAELLDITLI